MSFPNGLYSCPNYEKMDVTGRWELIKETNLRPLCVSKRIHASDTAECVPHRCLKCQRLHNHAVHCTFFHQGYSEEISLLTVSPHDSAQQQDRPKKDWTSTPQEIDGDGCSETPSDLDLCTLKLQEDPVTRNPRTDPCEVSVNWISDIRHFGPDDGLEDDARIESANMCQGICPMTAQVGANVFDKPDGDRKPARRVRALLDSAAWGDRKFARRVRALLDSAAWRSPVPQELGRKLGFDHGAADICELSTFYDPQRVEATLKIDDVAPFADYKPNGQGMFGLSCPTAKGFDPLYRDRDANLLPSLRNPDIFADAEGALRAATLPLEVTQPSNAQARRAFLAERIKQLVWGSGKHHHRPNHFVAYPSRRRVNFDPLWNELIGFNLAGPIKMWLPCDRRRLDVIAGTIPILGDLRARELGVPLCGSFGFGELLEDWPKQDEVSVSLLRDLSKPSGTFALPYLCSKYRSFSLIFFSRDCFWLLRCGFDQDSSSGCPNRSPRSTCSDERPLDC